MIHVIEYRQWQREVELEWLDSQEYCPWCEGSGYEECDECFGIGYGFYPDDEDEDEDGDEREGDDCQVCDGEGRLTCEFCHNEPLNDSRRDYRKAIIEDAIRYADFTGIEPLAVIGGIVKTGALHER